MNSILETYSSTVQTVQRKKNILRNLLKIKLNVVVFQPYK